MIFAAKLLFSRLARQKSRALFILVAIAASSCLVVWTIGGFQALFLDAVKDAEYLGFYDLRIALKDETRDARREGGKFASPLARENYQGMETPQKDDRETVDKKRRGEGRGKRDANDRAETIPQSLIDELRNDPAVAAHLETHPIKMFVYSPGTVRAILEDDDLEETTKKTVKRSLELDDDEVSASPQGVDPDLHRQAMGAYRAAMGTPLGTGSTFYGVSTPTAPFDLKYGRWLRDESNSTLGASRDAVLTVRGAFRLQAKVGDRLIALGRSTLGDEFVEVQLEVVGIVDDPESDGFYVSTALARELADAGAATLRTNAVLLKLRGGVERFRKRWSNRLESTTPALTSETRAEIAARKAAAIKENESFAHQSSSGATLAGLAALLIVFTALNAGVEENKRLIAFYRALGLTRGQVAFSILCESAALALPGWCVGMAAGWLLVLIMSGKATGLNLQAVAISFVCTACGAVVAALYPMLQSARVKPLEALGIRSSSTPLRVALRRARTRFIILTVVGATLIALDAALIRRVSWDVPRRAALHSGFGVLALALGTALLVPLALRLVSATLAPLVSRLARVDGRLIRRELLGATSRATGVAIALSVGGGLFVSMQIWGYSMLDPFLPGRRTPDAFVAFLPNALTSESERELRASRFVDPNRFIPVAVEQAAFVEGSARVDAKKSQFANVVFFGVDVEKAFEGARPLVGVRFRQGTPREAFRAMKEGRGVVVVDSLSIDYGLNLGDVLKVVHPRDPKKTFEYPIVGVVSFPGWQWLSKTGGVRRNFGRSGGLVFAREEVVAQDYDLVGRGYYWFDAPHGVSLEDSSCEEYFDRLAAKNLARVSQVERSSASVVARTAYAKLSTREALTASITRRADSVIWGLSKTPIAALIVASIATAGAIANSIRARRWSFGIMRALGMTRFTLARTILVEGFLIGCVAAVASFFFGFLAAQGALKLGRSMFGTVDPPLVLPWKGLLFGFLLTSTLCLLAALQPAWKTAKTAPLELMQSGRARD